MTHDPDPSTVTCIKVTDGIKSDGYVSGIMQMASGGQLHMTYMKDDQNFYYFIFDWTDND